MKTLHELKKQYALKQITEEEYKKKEDTDDYAPLNAGYFPFNVEIYEDGEVKIKPESAAAMGHERRVIELRRGGRKLSSYTVVAKDENQALQIATSMQKCQGK